MHASRKPLDCLAQAPYDDGVKSSSLSCMMNVKTMLALATAVVYLGLDIWMMKQLARSK